MQTLIMQVFTFEATWIGHNGYETDSLAISAANLADAEAVAVREINGVNSFADCLISLDLLDVQPDLD
jgi:hypothetical protein